ncbi:unnamed protein product [Alopecurus aequalis]
MLSRAQMLGKGTKRPLDLFVQTSSVLRRSSNLQQQIHHLHRQPEPTDGFPQKQYPLSNSISGAPPTFIFESNWTMPIFESNWTMRRCFSTADNSDDTPLDSKSGAVGRSLVQRLAILKSIGDCVNEYELMLVLKKKAAPVCYVWCDPSPWMHITQGIAMAINVNKMIKAGCKVKILMTDWFARMDYRIGGRVGGDLSKMQTIGLYNVEMWKATGMDLGGVEFVRLSDSISCNADEYWPLAMDIARKSNRSTIKSWHRVRASIDTRGYGRRGPYIQRDFTGAEIFHPCLQSASILFQKADLWLLGLDQRGPHMIARQYCNLMEMENKPIALFHNMPPNLLEYPERAGLDDPRWAIFMEDDEEDIMRKIKSAFCPPESAEDNPCLEYIKHIILPWFGKFEVVQKEENGGSKTFTSMEDLTGDYESGALHPSDVKQALVKAINMMLQPVRDHFRSSAEAKKLVEEKEKLFPMHW